jgi:hypothetical protein
MIVSMGVNHEEHVGETELGGAIIRLCKHIVSLDLHIKDTVSDDLSIDRDLVGSLSESENHGVGAPEAVD